MMKSRRSLVVVPLLAFSVFILRNQLGVGRPRDPLEAEDEGGAGQADLPQHRALGHEDAQGREVGGEPGRTDDAGEHRERPRPDPADPECPPAFRQAAARMALMIEEL